METLARLRGCVVFVDRTLVRNTLNITSLRKRNSRANKTYDIIL